jgi:hypothetical protein
MVVDDKNIKISKTDYDGHARAGQIVVDTSDYTVWVGTDTGELVPVGGGGAAGSPMGPITSVQFNDGGGQFGGDADLTFIKASNTLNVANLSISGSVTGHLLPSTNITQDLGSSTRRWRDLWLSGTTIHLGGQEISSDGSNIILSGGLVVSPESGIFNESGNSLLFSGDYADLVGAPDLSVYATESYVDAAVAGVSGFSGDYNDLTNKPDLTNYAQFDEDGSVTFPDGTVQTTAYIPATDEIEPPYRGFYAAACRRWGTDRAFYQVILANTSEHFGYNSNVSDTNYDSFFASGLESATKVVLFNVYTNSNNDVISKDTLKTVTQAFIDNVLYDDETEVVDATTARDRFYSEFGQFTSTISTELDFQFQFGGSNLNNFEVIGATGSNVLASFYIDSGTLNYMYGGHDDSGQIGSFTEGEVIVIPGDQLGGVTPDNDMTLTILTNGSGHYIGANVTGVALNSYQFYPNDSIDDGGNDIYDGGNFIETNVSGGPIPYNRGIVTNGDSYWGSGSHYVVTYKDGVFAMMAFQASVSNANYSGELGYDGSGNAESVRLIGGPLNETQVVSLGDFVFQDNVITTLTEEDIHIRSLDDDIFIESRDDIRFVANYDGGDEHRWRMTSEGEFRLAVGGIEFYDGTTQTTAVDPNQFATTSYVDSAIAGVSGGASASVSVSATAPESPSVGDLWYDETEARTFVWNGYAWIDASPPGEGISISTLKSIVADSTDFADFKARIASL